MKELRILNTNGDAIPKDIAKKASEFYNPKFSSLFKREKGLNFMFDWSSSKDGHRFWNHVYDGEYEFFYAKYPKSIDNYSII